MRHDAYVTCADVYRRLCMDDSLNAYCRRIYLTQDSVLSHSYAVNVLNSEARMDMLRNEERHKAEKKEERMWILLSGTVTLLLAGIVLSDTRLRMQRHKIEELKSRHELELERRRLVSSALVMTEKDNFLESMLGDIAEIKRSPDIRHKLGLLEQSLRLHLSGREDWDVFKAMFDKVHPSFSANLKHGYPRLTEGDIRLAIYLKSGLTTKQIVRMLLLQPDSVKKNRQRLRRHLELDSGVSLETFLRSFDGSGDNPSGFPV